SEPCADGRSDPVALRLALRRPPQAGLPRHARLLQGVRVELSATARVRLPQDLGAASLDALTCDVQDALASPAPIVALVGATADTFCTGLAIGSGTDDATPTHAFSDLLTAM